MNSVSSVASARPPTTTVATLRCTSLPTPVAQPRALHYFAEDRRDKCDDGGCDHRSEKQQCDCTGHVPKCVEAVLDQLPGPFSVERMPVADLVALADIYEAILDDFFAPAG